MTTDPIRMSSHQTLRVVDSTPEALVVESTWQPGGSAPPAHWHPRQHEHFEVLEGEVTARVDGETRVLGAGDTLDVPPRTVHAMWNAGATPCRASWRVAPPQRTEEMFRTLDRGPGALGKVALLWWFRHEFRLGKPRR